MAMHDGFWAWLATHKGQALLAGALGGVVRTITLRERPMRDGILNVVAGGIAALYLTPLVEPVLRPFLGAIAVPPDGVTGFAGFVVGLGGVAAAGFIVDVWAARRRGADGGGNK
jgi:hypothetical protein